MLLSYQSGCETNSKPIQISSDEIEVFFSPQGGCTEAIVKTLDQAKSSVLIQAYSFTSSPIAKAVVEAHKRGVQTEVILDKSQRSEKYSSADFFAHAGKCSN
jgi:phosphatidylserine/phosphatidylglycerophosphate/cardiolipin synthase-like enzyme